MSPNQYKSKNDTLRDLQKESLRNALLDKNLKPYQVEHLSRELSAVLREENDDALKQQKAEIEELRQQVNDYSAANTELQGQITEINNTLQAARNDLSALNQRYAADKDKWVLALNAAVRERDNAQADAHAEAQADADLKINAAKNEADKIKNTSQTAVADAEAEIERLRGLIIAVQAWFQHFSQKLVVSPYALDPVEHFRLTGVMWEPSEYSEKLPERVNQVKPEIRPAPSPQRFNPLLAKRETFTEDSPTGYTGPHLVGCVCAKCRHR